MQDCARIMQEKILRASKQVLHARFLQDSCTVLHDLASSFLLGLGHVNKISCFSSFCLQKFGEGGGYLLFIFRGQRSYATIFTGVKLGYKRRVKGKTETTQVKKE